MADKKYVAVATIVKFQKQEDGSLIVQGKFTDETLDSDKQRVDLKWATRAIKEWFETGANVRVMHSHLLYPAGKGLSIEERPDGVYGSVRVIDPTAIRLIEGGALMGFSIGISNLKLSFHDVSAPEGVIVGGKVFEISLVDRPANPACMFVAVKSATKITNPWRFANTEEGRKLEKMATEDEAVTDKSAGWLATLAPVHALLCKGSGDTAREAHADAFENAAGVLSGPAVKTTIHEMLTDAVANDDVEATARLSKAYKGLADVVTFGETSPFDLDAAKKGAVGDGLATALGAIHDAIAEALPGICQHEEPDGDEEVEVEADAEAETPAEEAEEEAAEEGADAEPDAPAEEPPAEEEKAVEGTHTEEEQREEVDAASEAGVEEQDDQEDRPLSEATKAAVAEIVKAHVGDFRTELEAVKAENAALKAEVDRLGGLADLTGAPQRVSAVAHKRATEARKPQSMRSFKSFLSSVAGSDASVFANETARAALDDLKD